MPTLTDASAYCVQVASDERFDKIVRSLKVAGNASTDLSSLPNGNWFARVRGVEGKPSLVQGDLKPGVYPIRLQNAAVLRSQTYQFELSGNWAQTVFDQASVLQAIK